MTESKLIQATLLALTKQNVSQKAAPLSTQLMTGMVINRNIGMGEPVVCYYNDSGELLRVGNVPNHAGDFFVDENNRMYYRDNGILMIRDGLSGEIIGDTTLAYDYKVANGGVCAAYRTSAEANSWRVILHDGEISAEMTFDFTQTPGFGYRNGIIAVYWSSGTYGGEKGLRTYTQSGNLLSDIQIPNEPRQQIVYAAPINQNTVGIQFLYGVGFFDITVGRYAICSAQSYEVYNPWDGYDTSTGSGGSTVFHEDFHGYDQAYFYTGAQIYEEVEGEKVHVKTLFARHGIDRYTGIEEIKEYVPQQDPVFYTPPTPYGNFIQQTINADDEIVRTMIDINTMTPHYLADLPNLPGTSAVRENAGWIWIDGYGVYQKTWLGWLMYASSTYPRSAPWGRLGYAVGSANIGEMGRAIVVFE